MSQMIVITHLLSEDIAQLSNLNACMRNVVNTIAPSMAEEPSHALAAHLALEIGRSRINMLTPSIFMEPVESRYNWIVAPFPTGASLSGIRKVFEHVATGEPVTQASVMNMAAYMCEDQLLVDGQTMNLTRRMLNFFTYVNSKLSERTDGLGLMIKNVGVTDDFWVLMAHYPS